MEEFVDRYKQPPYMKARRKLRRYTNFWFVLGTGSMVVASVTALVLLLVELLHHSALLALATILLPLSSIAMAEFVCKPQMVRGHERLYNIIQVIHRINVRKIMEGQR